VISGIYRISGPSEKVYIGSARKVAQRWWVHRTLLRSRKHHSIHLQRSWDKHGEAAFVFEVVEQCSPEQLAVREQFWLDHYGRSRLYNMRMKAESQRGYRHREETKAKMRGRVISEETRQKMREAQKKRIWLPRGPLAEEHKQKLRAARRGQPAAWNKGRKLSAEHRAKLSAAHVGKPRPWSRGVKHSEETRRKLSEAWKTRPPFTDATREKMRASAKIGWLKRKGATNPLPQ